MRRRAAVMDVKCIGNCRDVKLHRPSLATYQRTRVPAPQRQTQRCSQPGVRRDGSELPGPRYVS
jgi:hypothetical protein